MPCFKFFDCTLNYNIVSLCTAEMYEPPPNTEIYVPCFNFFVYTLNYYDIVFLCTAKMYEPPSRSSACNFVPEWLTFP